MMHGQKNINFGVLLEQLKRSFIDFYLLILYHLLWASSAHGKIKRVSLLLPGISEQQADRQGVWKLVNWNKDTFVSFVLLKKR